MGPCWWRRRVNLMLVGTYVRMIELWNLCVRVGGRLVKRWWVGDYCDRLYRLARSSARARLSFGSFFANVAFFICIYIQALLLPTVQRVPAGVCYNSIPDVIAR